MAGWKMFYDIGVPVLLIAGLAYATRNPGRQSNPFVWVEPAYGGMDGHGGQMSGCGCGCKGAPGGCRDTLGRDYRRG